MLSEHRRKLPISCLNLFNYSFMFRALLPCISFHCAQRNSSQSSGKPCKEQILYRVVSSHFMHKVGRDNPIKNLFFAGLARTLGGVPLSAMERYARKQSPEHERVIEKIKTRYW